jgi:hypothetical protein
MKSVNTKGSLNAIEGLVELTPAEAARCNGGLSGWGIFGIVLGSVAGLAAIGVGIGIAVYDSNPNKVNVGGPW